MAFACDKDGLCGCTTGFAAGEDAPGGLAAAVPLEAGF
jgi:hypothetical protein